MKERKFLIKVVVRVRGVGEYAEPLLESIRPDNKTAPSWLKIEEKIEGGDLVVTIVGETAQRIHSVRNTVDEIVAFLYATLKTLEEVAKTKRPS